MKRAVLIALREQLTPFERGVYLSLLRRRMVALLGEWSRFITI